MWTDTVFTRRFGLSLPIVQGPFGGGLSSTALTAAVSRTGGLGSYGANALEPEQIPPLIAQLRNLAGDKPFALNFWVNPEVEPTQSDHVVARTLELLAPYYRELGIAMPASVPQRCVPDYANQVDAALRAGVPVLSFVFGVPSVDVVRACHQRGVLVMGTATTVEEAQALDDLHVDAIVATGFEAGGHRPSFLRPAEECLTGTMALVPMVVDAVRVPVIAAGGIADGRGVAAALSLGASGVQLGTAFLACEESGAPPQHREALLGAKANDSALTRVHSGRLVRALRNRFSQELEPHGHELASYPLLNWLNARIRRAAASQGKAEFMSLQAGQVTPLLRQRSAVELIEAIVGQTTRTLEALTTK